jgi:NADH-quinone oxidoreductase subunit M
MDTSMAQNWLQFHSLSSFPLLTLLCAMPLAFGLIALAIPDEQEWAHKAWSFVGSLATLVIALVVLGGFDRKAVGLQMVDDYAWIPSFHARWSLGVDGLSLPLVLLTAFLMPLIFAGAWSAIDKRWKEFGIAMLVLETGMLGSLVAVDLLSFYVFWEIMLVPMYLIVGIWGGKDRIYATIKFFLYTMFGSLLMLVAILYLYQKAGGSFALAQLAQLQLSDKEQTWLFAAFALAFLIKVPVFPFHTWLPDAHTEAPTPGSVVLAGVMLKLGSYGLLRFAIPLFPSAMGKFSPLLLTLAVIGIVFGALMAYVQTDVKRLVAYSSVSHLGFVMLGIVMFNEEALQGSILQGVNHGISTGALFLLVGYVYERRHTREIADFGGIAAKMPVYAAFFVFITMSSIALPLTNGFVGEFLIFAGTFKDGVQGVIAPIGPAWPLWHPGAMHNLSLQLHEWRTEVLLGGSIATLGIVLGAVYMLSMVRRVFFGQITNPANQALRDLNWREKTIMAVLAVFVLWIGVYPSSWLNLSKTTVHAMVLAHRPAILQVRAPLDYKHEANQAHGDQ